jgi:hypothetical protein
MDCEPWRGLAGYIRDVKKVRDELADYVFTGEQLDPGEASFGDGEKQAGIEHAVYRNLRNGKRACIITNRGSTPATANFAGFGASPPAQVKVVRPGAQSLTILTTPAQLTVDAERIVFVVEN